MACGNRTLGLAFKLQEKGSDIKDKGIRNISLRQGELVNYDNLQEAAKKLAVPLERWLETSGNEVMREDIGALKLANWDARVDFESGKILETGLTYWAANTRSGLRFGMSPSKESAREDALSALAETALVTR